MQINLDHLQSNSFCNGGILVVFFVVVFSIWRSSAIGCLYETRWKRKKNKNKKRVDGGSWWCWPILSTLGARERVTQDQARGSAIPGTSLVYGHGEASAARRLLVCAGTANLWWLQGKRPVSPHSSWFKKREKQKRKKEKVSIVVKGATTNHVTDGIEKNDCFASKRAKGGPNCGTLGDVVV